ncbi:MAG TPA: ParB/RepB/Spo0J family partition protein [Anaerolineae bacterium]|jgi:ParB family chromosome partitioning protein|nr:ParB/RepB/Spo0J family partition protein [Anaerolineae bacterium]
MTKRRALGRGLGSLIPASEQADDEDSGLFHVSLDAISPNPHQPRSNVDQEKLAELAASIREHGLIQPLVVTEIAPGSYSLIAGERRWRAAALAGLSEIPVVVKEASPQDMLELALIENLQRDDLNALEEALAYQQLIDEFGMTQEEVAKSVGKSRPTVANMVRILKLGSNIQAAIVDGRISGAHARALLPLPTPEAQTAVMQTIIKNDLNVRQVEALVKKMLAGERPQPKKAQIVAPELVALEDQFSQSLGTKVNIHQGAKGGKVVIHYYSNEELQAIYESIVGDS